MDKLEDGAGVLERDLGNLAKRSGAERQTWNVDSMPALTESTVKIKCKEFRWRRTLATGEEVGVWR